MSTLPPPRPAATPAAVTWPGRARGLPAAGEGSVAGLGERFGARVIDLVVLSVGLGVLAGLEAAARAVTGLEATEEGDALTTLVAVAFPVWVVGYESVTTRKLGGTLGKRALGLRVVSQSLEPAGAIVVGGRAVVQFFLWGFCGIPGVLDLVAGSNDADRRTWHDRIFGTLVLRTKGASSSPSGAVSVEPWRSLVNEARSARDRFTASTGSAAVGPLADRLKDLKRHVDRCVTECERAAARGQELAALVRAEQASAARHRASEAAAAAAASPERPDLQTLAAARASEAASAERLVGLVERSERSVQVLVAQLNDAVNRAIELAFTAPAPESLDDLILQLESLQAAFAEAESALEPPR